VQDTAALIAPVQGKSYKERFYFYFFISGIDFILFFISLAHLV
jgi:hypothetical protein